MDFARNFPVVLNSGTSIVKRYEARHSPRSDSDGYAQCGRVLLADRGARQREWSPLRVSSRAVPDGPPSREGAYRGRTSRRRGGDRHWQDAGIHLSGVALLYDYRQAYYFVQPKLKAPGGVGLQRS